MIASGPLFTVNPPLKHYQPRGPLLHVRFLPTATTWSSGLHIPESMQENASEAEVLAIGTGRGYAVEVADGAEWPAHPYFHSAPYPRVGDIVCFEQHMLRSVEANEACGIGDGEGFIDCEAVLGVVKWDGSLKPLSDWVLLKPEARQDETAGGVRLGDRVQRWRQSGTVLDFGPGYLWSAGTAALRRQTVPEILNLPSLKAGDVLYWKSNARILQLGREVVEAWLVRAGDFVAWEEPDALQE